MERKLVTVTEAATTLGIGRSLLYAMLMRGDIASVRIGRARRISTAALDAFVENLEAEEGNARGI